MKSRTWSTISTPGRPFLEPDRFSSPIHRPGRGFRRPGRRILGPGRRFQLLVDKSSTTPRTRSMKSRTWSTISTPGRPFLEPDRFSSPIHRPGRGFRRPGRRILGPGRRFQLLVDKSSTTPRPGRRILGPGRRFQLLVDHSSIPIDFHRPFIVLVEHSAVLVDEFSVPVDDFNSWSTNPRPLLGHGR